MFHKMLLVFCYIMFAYGLCNLLVYGGGPYNILQKMREYFTSHFKPIGEMLECMMCTSTNIGWIISLLNLVLFPTISLTPFNLLIEDMSYWYLIIIADACLTSGVVWLLHTAQEALERFNNN